MHVILVLQENRPCSLYPPPPRGSLPPCQRRWPFESQPGSGHIVWSVMYLKLSSATTRAARFTSAMSTGRCALLSSHTPFTGVLPLDRGAAAAAVVATAGVTGWWAAVSARDTRRCFVIGVRSDSLTTTRTRALKTALTHTRAENYTELETKYQN